MFWVPIRIASATYENYSLIITKYHPYLFHCEAKHTVELRNKQPNTLNAYQPALSSPRDAIDHDAK